VIAASQVVVGDDAAPPPRTGGPRPGTVDEVGLAFADGTAIGWPTLTLWRAPTDNDDPPGAWRPRPGPATAWRASGLDSLVPHEVDVRRGDEAVTRVARYLLAGGAEVVHRQTARARGSAIELSAEICVDPQLRDLPRVGVRFALPPGFEDLRWCGLGPGSSYPDRRAAVRHGTWASTVDDQHLPFLVPQEHGLHLGTSWLQLSSSHAALLVAGDDPFAFSALHHTAEDLTMASHAHLVPRREETFVHLDLAHRGLGTLACGPDTHERHRVHGGRYGTTWRFSLSAPRR
jgi:hypothetical protein